MSTRTSTRPGTAHGDRRTAGAPPARSSRPGSGAARRNGGVLGLLALTVVTELRSSLRAVEFAVGAVAIPVLLYAMFALPEAGNELPGGSRVGAAMLVSFCAYGVVSLAIFTFGEEVAKERGRGWTRTLRATPFPTGMHLLGKSAAALVHAAMIVVATSALAATAGGVRLPASTWIGFGLAAIASVSVFSALGFAIAYLARPRTATVVANLVFLPLAFASGFFVPLPELPDVVGDVAQYLPTFHLGQLLYPIVMPAADVQTFTGAVTQPVGVHLAWVLGSALVLGLLAIAGARREAVTRRG
jgi:ABC-2 type transport system permease protein